MAFKSTLTSLSNSWHRVWNNLRLIAPTDLLQRLVAAYDEPHRKYHSLQHLQECIAHFSNAATLAQHPGGVEIALWFHDAIYDLRGKDNEQRSGDWAVQALRQAGAESETQERVFALIMATRHEVVPAEPDQQLLVDIDLAILGATSERFEEYDQQVREEYSWVPGFVYNSKRKEVLKSFLARDFIYSTDFFRTRYEQQARTNLRAACR